MATDGGQRRRGKITFIASQAEFTPKNAQTRDERVKLVYKVKIGLENADGLFKPGEATIGADDQWLLGRIADALKRVPGQVDVIGHSDNIPIRTLRFPSNWELSRARAESVARLLAAGIGPGRIRADGRGDAEPVTANDTPQGRAKNRRVEITLHVPAGEPAALASPPAPPRKP